MAVDLTTLALNEEGFMTNPNEWTKEIAEVLAKQEDLENLTAEHWKIIDFCRQTGLTSGKSPTLRSGCPKYGNDFFRWHKIYFTYKL